jgi:cobalt-zinc-cadmium efflux system protein
VLAAFANTVKALLFMRGREKDLDIRGAILHMAADALVSVGVVVAGALALWMQWAWLDPVVSIVIGVVILVSTWSLFKQSLHLLFDGVPDSVDPIAVKRFLASLPGVEQAIDLYIWATGTTQITLTAHLVMPDGHAGDTFPATSTEKLHELFDIDHVTLQVTQPPSPTACSGGFR